MHKQSQCGIQVRQLHQGLHVDIHNLYILSVTSSVSFRNTYKQQ